MTKEQFEEFLKEFFNWSSNRPRALTLWLLSLEDWVKMEYNKL